MNVVRFLLTSLVLLPAFLGEGWGQVPACQTNADTASRYVRVVTQDLRGDSTRLTRQGLPYKPAQGVSLVTDTTVCRAIVNAYNALDTLPTHPAQVQHAYVFTAGNTVYVMVGEKARSVRVYFDTSYRWLAALVSLD